MSWFRLSSKLLSALPLAGELLRLAQASAEPRPEVSGASVRSIIRSVLLAVFLFLLACFLLGVVIAGFILFGIFFSAGTPSPQVAAPTEIVSGTTASIAQPTVSEISRIHWAESAEASSTFGFGYHAEEAIGAPNIYPRSGDLKGAWAPQAPNRGEEWLSASWDSPTRADQILIVETFNPGAVARVDDLSDPLQPVVLWQGEMSGEDTARALQINLNPPRDLQEVRVIIDAPRVSGWNEIDAVGIRPVR